VSRPLGSVGVALSAERAAVGVEQSKRAVDCWRSESEVFSGHRRRAADLRRMHQPSASGSRGIVRE